MRVYLFVFCFLHFITVELFSQIVPITNKSEIVYNNYDKKYYHRGTLFSGIMKSNLNEITFKDGLPNGEVKSYNKQGKLYRSLNYTNGMFQGVFFTENFKGTFLNDTLINRLQVYENQKLSVDYSFSLNDNTKLEESIKYYSNGKVDMKGVIICDKMTSYDLSIRINEFIQGVYFSYNVNLPKMDRYKMYFYSRYYENGQLMHKHIYNKNSIIGYVKYHSNGKISDSLVSLRPLNILEVSTKNYPKEYFHFVVNREYFEFDDKGKLINKNTQIESIRSNRFNLIYIEEKKENEEEDNYYVKDKYSSERFTKFDEDSEESDYDFKYSGEYIGSDYDGKLKDKWFFNDSGYLHGDYLSFYQNGQLKIKTSFTNGKINPSIDFYRENGTKRLKFYKLNEEYFFEEYFVDGNLKLKVEITEDKVKKLKNRLRTLLKIGEFGKEEIYIGEEYDLLDHLTY